MIDSLLGHDNSEGAPFRELGDFAELSNSGVDKKVVKGEKIVRLLNYMDVARNQTITSHTLAAETSAPAAKITACSIEKGDIFITPTSETIDEIGFAAVATESIENAVYSYHIMRIRICPGENIEPKYLMYLFRSKCIQDQILKRAQGITRFGLTLPKWRSIKFPLPPIATQKEIVRILDAFSELESELKGELEVRKKQYEFYRNQLLTFPEQGGVRWVPMGEVCGIYDGTHQTPTYTLTGVPFVSVENISDYSNSKKYISQEAFESQYKYKPRRNDLLFTRIGTVGACAVVKDDANFAYYVSLALLRPDASIVDPYYLKHFLMSFQGRASIRKHSLIQAIPMKINLGDIKKIQIPLPSIGRQWEIAAQLEKFDYLVSDSAEGIPAELSARRKQFEYYRDKLLTFKELEG